MADFQSQPAAGIETLEGFGDEAPDEVQSVRAAEERERRIVQTSRAMAWPFGFPGHRGDWRRCRRTCRPPRRKDRFRRTRLGDLQRVGVFPGQRESIRRNIGERQFPGRPFRGESEAEHSGAAAHIEHAPGFRKLPFQEPFGEFLGLRPGNERAGVGLELALVKPNAAEQVLERDALAAFFNASRSGRELGFVERSVELQV
jgi:hypothetical protein